MLDLPIELRLGVTLTEREMITNDPRVITLIFGMGYPDRVALVQPGEVEKAIAPAVGARPVCWWKGQHIMVGLEPLAMSRVLFDASAVTIANTGYRLATLYEWLSGFGYGKSLRAR